MTSGIDPAQNRDVLLAAVADAASAGALMLFTPEMSGLVDSNRKRAAENVRSQDEDSVLAAICHAAREHGLWVHIGSLALRGNDDRWVNRGFIIDDAGEIRAHYDKIHLFDVDLPTGESWRESGAYQAGERAVTVDTPLGRLGMGICYDLRFPALFAAQSDAGAQILTVPSCFTVPTGKAHWHTLLRARAIENAAWLVAATQTGSHPDGRATYGHSLVVDPWGEVVLDMGVTAGLGFADIDSDRTNDVRARIPVIAHRKSIAPIL